MKKQKIVGVVLGLLHIGGIHGSVIFNPPYGNGKNYSGSYASAPGRTVFTNDTLNVLELINQSSAPQQWAINPLKGGSGTGIYDAQIAGNTDLGGAVLNADNTIGVSGTGATFALVAQFNANGSLNSNLVFNEDITTLAGFAAGSVGKQYFSAIVSDGAGGYYVSGYVKVTAGPVFYGIVSHIKNTGWLELDTTFGTDGFYKQNLGGTDTPGFTGLGRQSTGAIVVAGRRLDATTIYVGRLLANGTLDTTFTAYNRDLATMTNVRGLVVDSQDRILIIGDGGGANGVIARFNANGGLDTTFNSTGYVSFAAGQANGLTVLSDNSVIGVGSEAGGNLRFLVVKYTAAGVLDTTFNGTGVVIQKMFAGSTVEAAQRVTVTPLGQIAVAGLVDPGTGINQTGVLLLDAYGALVPTFFNVGYTVQAINADIAYTANVGCLYQTMSGTTASSGLAIMGYGGPRAENIYFANPS